MCPARSHDTSAAYPAAPPAAPPRAGFTLVELLVVVTILALLISILMPSLKKARSQTKRTVCASNLRQIGIALNGYLADSNDRLPWASAMPSKLPFPVDLPEPIYIADVLAPYLSEQRELFRCPNDVPGGTERPAPNTGRSYFQSERSSYQYRAMPFLGGRTIAEVAAWLEEFHGQPVAENSIWVMQDYNNFHAPGGQPGARRYLYIDGHVTDFEN